MKAHPDKNYILWLTILLAVVALIVINRVGFYRPVPGFKKDVMKSIQQEDSEQAALFNQKDSIFQPSTAADFKRESIKEPRYYSERPLFFRVLFGKEGTNPMLGVIDETGGSGNGYDAAYIDENMNGDLTDDTIRKFSRSESGSRAGELDPRFEFKGPFETEGSAKYAINIYSLAPRYRGSVQGNEYHFFWYLNVKEWNYFFISGKMKLFSSAADALKGTPILLGGQCKWEISSQIRDDKSLVSAGLKDSNGCTLRIVRQEGKTVSPTLTLIKDGKVETEEKMKFG